MQQPVEVQVDEHEPIVERVAAIDVAKASGMVCLRIPHETIPGRQVTKVWPVQSTTAALVELGDHLRCERVARVVFFHLLNDPAAEFTDLGADFYQRRIDRARRASHLIRQLNALGYQVQITQAA